VDQDAEYPFLRSEKAAIRTAIKEDKAYLGFCLGHQLLADSLGARIEPNFCRSVGFVDGELTEDGARHPLFRGLPRRFSLFKWHGQAVRLPVPEEVAVLAASPECSVEAISVRGHPHLIGLQFDNHAASISDVRTWVEGDRTWLAEPPAVDRERILREAQKREAPMGEAFEKLFDNFMTLAF
jgi:GMP synthase-like glutamine amidotransferase